MKKEKVVIMGAAGRDFHNFNLCFRNNPRYEVVAFTAAQIPNISNRTYPPILSGKYYPRGIPILPEEELLGLIRRHRVDTVVLAYSDLSYSAVMGKAALVNAAGANFVLLGPGQTMLKANKPVIAITAVRTGSGKSPTTRKVSRVLKKEGLRPVVVRHPMPYGNLEEQVCQRFQRHEDIERHHCTIEEREEYEPLIEEGVTLFAGVDYQKILRQAEREADLILWDGGNNDFPFYQPDLYITLVDPHRPGHEVSYYPGEVNLRLAHVVIINKVSTAQKSAVRQVERNIQKCNPQATVIRADLEVTIDCPECVKNKRVLVVEDGPTLTHGGMPYGAGTLAARQYSARIIDPRPYLVGSLKGVFREYPHLGRVLPAMGYGKVQLEELREVIHRARCDVVVSGTPIDLSRVLGGPNKPIVRVRYELKELGRPTLREVLRK
ncbi:MAG: cyclic 2,3-diphosphoglycerate synthase, partial [Candidatus Brocadiales bacterium]|nr:cyclic 2,3-diphosphoglycerate synthase [Candidatus Brocadiales bacterium]